MPLSQISTAAIIICEQALVFEFCKATRMFYVTDPALSVRRAFPPSVMQETIARAARAYRDFRTETSAEIIPFPDQAVG